MERITPETYEKMNEEFVKDGTAVRIVVPTQEAIDKWLTASKVDIHTRNVKPRDMVADMWAEHNRIEEERKLQGELDL